MTNNIKGYTRRKTKKSDKSATVEIITPSVVPIRKVSGQIVDPFSEKQFQDVVIRPPYPLTKLLDFYTDNTWNNACINIKANLICGDYDIVPTEGEQKEDREYEALKNFLDMPNETGEDFLDLVNKLWVDAEAMGNFFLEVVRNAGGLLSEIYHVPAHTVNKHAKKPGYLHRRLRQLFGSSEDKSGIYYRAWGNKKDTGTEGELIHFKNYFPASRFYGMPDYIPALGAMILDRNAIGFNNQYFNNSGMLGQILFIKNVLLTPEQRSELRRMVQYNYTGVDNAHKMALIDNLPSQAEFKIEKVMEPIRDMSFKILRTFNRDEIIAAHRVPPKMLHIAEAGKLGESRDGYNQMKFFKIFEIDPSQRRIERILNRLFKEELGITKWKIKFTELDIRDPKEVSEEIWGDVERGIREINEGREVRGLEPLDNPLPPAAPPGLEKSDDLDQLIGNLEKFYTKINESLEGS